MEMNIESGQPHSDGKENNEGFMRAFVVKAIDGSRVLATSNKLPDDDFIKAQLGPRILPPPYDPFQLSILIESSSILSQCVDTMEVNVDSFGYELRPSVDEQSFKKLLENPEVKLEIETEEKRVKNFFKYCNRTMSYIQVRRRMRRDYETIGNGFWEILRNHLTGNITGIEWVPAHTVRVGRVDRQFTDCLSKVKISDVEIEIIPDKRKFRRFVQIKETQAKPVWFKEFGDPRLMDAETGGRAVIKRNDKGEVTEIAVEEDGVFVFSIEKFKAGRMRLATEIIHFVNFKSPRALPYGAPRWIGNLINIIGARESEEVNYLYFENKTVPPGMMLIAGGRLNNDAVERITNHIKDNVKGSKNFHSMLVVEAEAKRDPNLPAQGIPTIQWVPMKDSQNGDALFQVYDQNSIEKVISSFRFWSGYVGRTKEINVATAEVARQISEEQVFQPEREEFDSIINRTLLVEMNVNYWEHKSKGPQLTSPRQKAEIVDKMKNYLTGKEGRQIAESIFGRELEDLTDEWTNKPLQLVIAELAKSAMSLESKKTPQEQQLESMAKGDVTEPRSFADQSAKVQDEIQKLGEDPEVLLKFVQNVMILKRQLENVEERTNEVIHRTGSDGTLLSTSQ